MKYHQIIEGWKDNRHRLSIALEVENGDEIDEIPAEIVYTYHPNVPATHWQPAEGGVEDLGIIINGKEYNTTNELRSIGVVSHGGDFDKIIDAYIDDLQPSEPDPDEFR